MNELRKKMLNRSRRRNRVRARVSGTAERPRLVVRVSNRHISAQIIDDTSGRTVAATSTVGAKDTGDNMVSRAAWAGAQIGAQAKQAKVKKVVLDRGSKLYHGRIAAFAAAARETGLEF
jgi:large subunit ribosomal protein L18